MSYFTNKIIWLTGATSGIGYAVCEKLISEGGFIIASGRNKAVLAELKQRYPKQVLLTLAFDITDKAATLAAAKQIEALGKGLDIAIFNAGASSHASMKTFDSQPYINMININYFSILYGVEAALPLLRQSATPHLVGMSSIASYTGLPKGAPYCAAKAAARSLMQGLAAELTHENIPVSVICPGFVKTPLTDKNRFPMPFIMSPEKAARIIAKGLAKHKTEIHFPWQMSLPLKLVSSLPAGWVKQLIARSFRGQSTQ